MPQWLVLKPYSGDQNIVVNMSRVNYFKTKDVRTEIVFDDGNSIESTNTVDEIAKLLGIKEAGDDKTFPNLKARL